MGSSPECLVSFINEVSVRDAVGVGFVLLPVSTRFVWPGPCGEVGVAFPLLVLHPATIVIPMATPITVAAFPAFRSRLS